MASTRFSVPDLASRTAVVTGASGGLGLQTAKLRGLPRRIRRRCGDPMSHPGLAAGFPADDRAVPKVNVVVRDQLDVRALPVVDASTPTITLILIYTPLPAC